LWGVCALKKGQSYEVLFLGANEVMGDLGLLQI
jgi:hypothetical protein